jgi:hypothetical protein
VFGIDIEACAHGVEFPICATDERHAALRVELPLDELDELQQLVPD